MNQPKHVNRIFKQSWSSQFWHSQEHEPLPRIWPAPDTKRVYAYLLPAHGGLLDSFATVLQAHEDSGEKVFTEEQLVEITRIIRESKKNDKLLVVSLSEKDARTLAWRRTVSLFKTLVAIGAFRITNDHLASMRRLEKEAKPFEKGSKPQAIALGWRDWRRRFNVTEVLIWGALILAITLFTGAVERFLIRTFGSRRDEKEVSGQQSIDT